MKKLFILLFGIILATTICAQNGVKERTAVMYVNVTKDPPKPPYIEFVEGSLTFSDPDGNQIINANERANIVFQLKNSGVGPGLNLEARISEQNGISGINHNPLKSIGTLQPGAVISVEIPVSGTMNTPDAKAIFQISIQEANGFGIDPVIIEVPVKSFVSPLVKIVDYKITSQSGTIIEKRRPFEVQVLVQNVGQGRADEVVVTLPVPENMFCLTNNVVLPLGSMAGGEHQLIEYSLVANNNYTASDIRLAFKVSEKYDKYSENQDLMIAMNQPVAREKLVIRGRYESPMEITPGSLTSAVDKNIPYNANKKPNRIALIIGNEDYSGSLNAEVNVAYAVNDAAVFRQYAINTLGVPEENVYFSQNATAGEMRRVIDLVAKLLEKMGTNSELIFYYAGHGLPDEATKVPYLIPVDVNAGNLSAAIKLSDVYSKFGNSGAGRITVFLDACFTGGGRNQGLLAARGVRIIPKSENITGNMVVFAAASGEQSALPLDREKHGLFTYFLLKKLQETSGDVTYDDLANYISRNVAIESLREVGKEQDPKVNISPRLQESWKTWKITGQ